MEVLELPAVGRKRRVQVKPGEQLPLIRFGEADVWAKAREALGWSVEFGAKRAGFKSRKPIVALEAGQGTTRRSSLQRIAKALGIDVKQAQKFGRILEASTATFQREVSMTTGDAPADTNPGEGSLSPGDAVPHPDTPSTHSQPFNEKERALMESPVGRAVIALMAGFNSKQLDDLHDAAFAINKRGPHHAPKEGLSP